MKHIIRFPHLALLGLLIFQSPAAAPAIEPASITTLDFETLRQQAINRPRRLIFNNDGNEPVYFCDEASKAELLRSRTAPLAGSQVDSIFYCTWSSGFGLFTHHTKVGQLFNTREAMFAKNLTQDFLDKGIDPLQVMVEFGHQHGMEVFWSMRMNDTHDGARAEYSPVMFRANQLKVEHPEYLIGANTPRERPRYGVWSAVDYGVAEVRDLAFRYCEEVCRNYDVDGIELDFFRHAFLFKCSGRGEPCGDTELDQLTELIQRIRNMTGAVGRKKQKPILLAVRVPDSIEYCRFIGIDLEKWLADGLIDLLIVSGYTQLNPWEYSVELARRHGVKVYPSLDEPRVHDDAARKLRAEPGTYRGRALNALAAGMDGVYMFNFFNPHSSLWRELGDKEALLNLKRNYFVSVRGPGSMVIPHQKFIAVQTLNPANPLTSTNGVIRVNLQTGEPSRKSSGTKTDATLRLRFSSPPENDNLPCAWNGVRLKNGKPEGDWLEFKVSRASIHRDNTIEISTTKSQDASLSLTDAVLVIDADQ